MLEILAISVIFFALAIPWAILVMAWVEKRGQAAARVRARLVVGGKR